jgi:hypothetical protein
MEKNWRTTAAGAPVINADDEIDRLISFHASIPDLHHRLPFLRAVRARQISMCQIERGGSSEIRELERLSQRLLVLLLIGDDDHLATGPVGWLGLRRIWYWRPRKVVVHATGGSEAISQDIMTATEAGRTSPDWSPEHPAPPGQSGGSWLRADRLAESAYARRARSGSIRLAPWDRCPNERRSYDDGSAL